MSTTIDLFNRKKVYSAYSDQLVTFVPEIKESMFREPGMVYSNGMNLVDNNEGAFDDIKNMYCVLKTGETVSMQKFYEIHDAYTTGSNFVKDVEMYIADREEGEMAGVSSSGASAGASSESAGGYSAAAASAAATQMAGDFYDEAADDSEEELIKVAEKKTTTYSVKVTDLFPERIVKKLTGRYTEKLVKAVMEIDVIVEAYHHDLVDNDVDTKISFWNGVEGCEVLYELSDLVVYCTAAEVDSVVERLIMIILGEPAYWDNPFRSLAEKKD